MNFFVGLHQPGDCPRFARCMVSAKRLRDLKRKSDIHPRDWMLDSGAFSEIKDHGHYRSSVDEYAQQVRRWSRCGNMLAAVSQDYMCEDFILKITGLTTADHQRFTIERYDALKELIPEWPYILPVLQGFWPEEYVSCIEQYGERLTQGMWVGVGSVCKRNARVEDVEQVLMTIRKARPDLRLHGFGLKITALESATVRKCLHSADSMAWSKTAFHAGKNHNHWTTAQDFVDRIEGQIPRVRQFQPRLFS